MALLVRKPYATFEVCDADLELTDDVGDPETFYTLRPLTSKQYEAIESEYARVVFDKATHRRRRITPAEETEDDQRWRVRAFGEAILDYVVIGWRGVVDAETRTPIPCTSEMKPLALGPLRQRALLKLADINVVERDHSFRPAAGVRGVSGGPRADGDLLPDGAGGDVTG